ncbi:MAG TPA: MmgE/PrpD family protein, partial [Bryobacteraceae bacterium]
MLHGAVWLLPATAFLAKLQAFGLTESAPDLSPVMLKLSTYMAAASTTELPEKVVQDTKHHILDTIAAMVSGSELPPGRDAIQFARTYGGGQKVATVVASKIVCGPIDAAFANGELAHADESDDDYTSGGAHPGCAVVPAALAMGEQFQITGTHFLRAVT